MMQVEPLAPQVVDHRVVGLGAGIDEIYTPALRQRRHDIEHDQHAG